MGQGKGLSLVGRQMKIEFIEDGEKVVQEVSANRFYVLSNRELREARAPLPNWSTAASPGGLMQMLQLKGAASLSPVNPVNPPPVRRGRRGSASRWLRRGRQQVTPLTGVQ